MTDNQKELLKEDTVAEETRDNTTSVGEILKKAREANGQTVEDIAGRLHLRPSLVRDIEADKFDSISSATYTRGYVRNYARILGVDEDEVMDALARQVPSEAEPAMQSFSRKTSQKARDSRLTLVTWLIAIVLAALLVLWWVQKSTMSTDIDLSQPSAEEVAAAVELGSTAAGEPAVITSEIIPLQAEPASQTQSQNTEESSVSQALSEPQTSQDSAPAIVTPSQSESQGTETAATDTFSESRAEPQASESLAADANLSVSLAGDCWMKVTDATGKVLIHGVKAAGRSMDVSGVAPFELVIGAPQVVTLQYNGENISLADYPAGKVARFSLPQA